MSYELVTATPDEKKQYEEQIQVLLENEKYGDEIKVALLVEKPLPIIGDPLNYWWGGDSDKPEDVMILDYEKSSVHDSREFSNMKYAALENFILDKMPDSDFRKFVINKLWTRASRTGTRGVGVDEIDAIYSLILNIVEKVGVDKMKEDVYGYSKVPLDTILIAINKRFRNRRHVENEPKEPEYVDKWARSCDYDKEQLKTDLKSLFIDESIPVTQPDWNTRARETLMKTHTDKGCPFRHRDYHGITETDKDKGEEECNKLFQAAIEARDRMKGNCFK